MKKAIRTVIDTNIVISSLWGGNAKSIIDLWAAGKITAVLSPDVLGEYTDVLAGFNVSQEQMESFLEVFMDSKYTVFVNPAHKIDAVKKDRKDNMFIECAIAGKADYIISGDKHLLEIKEYGGIKIVKAAELLAIRMG
jgi:uncharacterized protein